MSRAANVRVARSAAEIVAVATFLLMLSVKPAPAQMAQPAAVAVDTVVNVDRFVDADPPRPAGVGFDGYVALRVSRNLQIVAQPVARRLPNGMWIERLYQLAVRFESSRGLPLRVEAGQIMSPIGIGALQYRADLNPTITFPATYFLGLPQVEAGAPRVEMMSAGYPVGALVTTSARGWDARAGVLDSSPVRYRRSIFEDAAPRSAQLVAGGGYSPRTGLRVGASLVRGRYAKADEIGRGTRFDRNATITGVEWEYAFRYTKLSGEWLRDSFDTAGRPAVAQAWLVEWTQTLTPRWYLASRLEHASLRRNAIGPGRLSFGATDFTVGYRLNRDLTLRAGHVARRPFNQSDWDHLVGASIVWARRWQ